MARHILKTQMMICAVAVVILSCCSSKAVKESPPGAFVPEAARRLTYDLTRDSVAVIDKAVREAVCLVISGGDVAECRENPDNPLRCNSRVKERVAEVLRPAFKAILKLKLQSVSTINASISQKIPGAFSTYEVYDARRTFRARDWKSSDGACVAINIDVIWILLHAAPDGDGSVDRFEVFLANPTCDDMLLGS